ncbi:LysR family transcriptional regulator [Orrella sp. JC864]|uniref:LysR family transcriptional regulator n=1 Tax=Orrella sp. JC864 TaxID=3120298 RepID=UPI0012BCAC2E
METQFVDTFVMIAECGSMAEAARRLNVTPTALAQRVRALERELGVTLFTRSGRFVRVTESGARLLVRARQFQQEVRELKAAASADGFPGGLRIGAIRTALTHVMPEILRGIARRYPRLDAALEIGASHDLYHLVASGNVHAALMVEPPFPIPKSFAWHPLRVEPLVLLAPAGLPASDDADTLLREQPLIRYDRRTWGGLLADQYLRQRGLQPQERFELDSPDGIQVLVGLGLGVSLVPDCFREGSLPAEVVRIALPGNTLARRLGMLWPVGSPYARLFEMVLPEAARA